MIVTITEPALYLPESKVPRTPGIHLSSIIRCIATEQRLLKNIEAEEVSLLDFRDIVDPVAILRINIGLAWEEHYIPMLKDVVDHPGEFCVEGVYMTPDGELLVIITRTRQAWVEVIEVKATYKGINTVADLTTPTSWMWRAQMMAYCKALKALRAQLHVLYLCGDYSWPMTPRLLQYNIEFTQEEIDDNWRLMIDYRDLKVAEEMDELHANEFTGVLCPAGAGEAA